VVLKILSRDIAHKSEIGGVQLNLHNRLAVKRAYKQCVENAARLAPKATVDGALLMEQKSGGIECILGVKRDPVFGPMVAFGLGGIFVETFRDVALRPAPLTVAAARAMIGETRAAKILAGARGKPPADIDCIARALVALGNLAVAAPAILAIDVNPFLVFEEGGVALDAVVELALEG
jgi:hypothetical protein